MPTGAHGLLLPCRGGGGSELDGNRLVAALLTALLGLENKAAASIEIDPADAHRAVGLFEVDRPFEHIIVALASGFRGVGAGQAQEIAETDQKELIICPLLPAFAALPIADEILNLFRGGIGSHVLRRSSLGLSSSLGP